MAFTAETEVAYFAGLLDGEGYISVAKRGRHFAPIVNITNTNLDLLYWVQDRFGGEIYPVSDGRNFPNAKDCYRIMWNGHGEIATVIAAVMPYLVAKKAQAHLIAEFLSLPSRQGKKLPVATQLKREELCLAAKSLNKKGR